MGQVEQRHQAGQRHEQRGRGDQEQGAASHAAQDSTRLLGSDAVRGAPALAPRAQEA
jgi:hypothetical protein